jgi:hypothetical protein
VTSLDPTGQGRRRWTMRWKPALNAFEMTFDPRKAMEDAGHPPASAHHHAHRHETDAAPSTADQDS